MGIMSRVRTLPAGFVEPCLPTKTDKLPSGSQWLHEIKHDGFRIIARKTGAQVRLYSRPGNDLPRRFPLIVETLARLRSRSGIIDGEAVACDDNGVASFDLVLPGWMILSDFKVIAVKLLFFSLNQINWLGSDCKIFGGNCANVNLWKKSRLGLIAAKRTDNFCLICHLR